MRRESESLGNEIRLRLKGRVDPEDVQELQHALDLPMHTKLIVDLRDVGYFDSRALEGFITAVVAQIRRGKSVRITNSTQEVRDCMRDHKMRWVFKIFNEEESPA